MSHPLPGTLARARALPAARRRDRHRCSSRLAATPRLVRTSRRSAASAATATRRRRLADAASASAERPPAARRRLRIASVGIRGRRVDGGLRRRSRARSRRSAACRHQGRPAPVHRCGRAAEPPHRRLRQGDAARVRRRERTAVQGARSDPRGLRPAQADARSPERRRRRVLSQRRRGPVRALEGGQARASTNGSPSPTSTTTRSRTSTSRSSATRRASSIRATGCWPARRSTRATRRCS